MNFEAVLKLLIENFEREGIRFALIGGLALHSAGYARATKDIDFLIPKEDVARVKKIMTSSGYSLIHESEDASNYEGSVGPLGRVDFLHAHRKYARAMLDRSPVQEIFNGTFHLKVIRPEDLIGLKVQSSSNDPERYHQDMADIEQVIRANYQNLDRALLEEYFSLFGRQDELKAILGSLGNA